jgi:hypothetical protein
MRKNHDQPAPQPAAENDAELLGRRTLLRRAGTIAAIAGGAAVVSATGTGTAQAASGDPVTQGSVNNAGTSATSLTSASTAGATLTVGNTSSGGTTARGPLLLAKSDDTIFDSTATAAGELYVGDDNSDLFFVNTVTAPQAALVFTEVTANQVIGIKPVRVLDTRSASSRTAVVINPSVLDSSGRQKGGTWMNIDMSALAIFFESAFVNLTAVAPTGNGFLTIAPAPPVGNGQPATSNLNYVKGVNLANSAVAPTADGTVWIYTPTTTHVLLDVGALNMPSTAFLLGAVPAADQVSNAQLQAAFANRRNVRRSS